METIENKQDQLEKILTNLNLQKETIYTQQLCNSQQDNTIIEMLPIINEDGLAQFENKLSIDTIFRSNIVRFFKIIKYIINFTKNKHIFQILELQRHAKKNLTATVRQILRTLFDDSILKEYSFKGQKAKKVFSTLNSCSIIFGKISLLYFYVSHI